MQLAYYNVDSINNNKGKKEDEDILFWGFVYSYSGVRVWVSI